MNAISITPAEFWKLHSIERDATLIDVSELADFDHIHAEGSVHLTPQDVLHLAKQARICNKSLYLISRRGQFAAALGGELERRGYGNVTSISGGTEAWAASGLPVRHERSWCKDLMTGTAALIVVGSIASAILIADILMLPVLALAGFIAVALVLWADSLGHGRTRGPR